MNRRNLMKMIPPGLLLPGQILSDFSWEHGFFNESLRSSSQQQKIAELFKKAIIIDGLVISRDWNEESFDALTKSGYTGFGTSLASGSLKSALKSLTEWQKRIEINSDKLIFAAFGGGFTWGAAYLTWAY